MLEFKEFIKICEQGTVGGPLGGPGASGALGMSLVSLPKPQIKPVSLIDKKKIKKIKLN